MLNIDFFTPAMASVGHLTSQSVQPMQVLRMVCGNEDPLNGYGLVWFSSSAILLNGP